MNTTNHLLSQANAHDALYDQIERELRALTIARLDGADSTAGAQRHYVDEFADDYPLCFRSMPPPRRHQT